MTVNGDFMLNCFCAGTSRIFCVDFENNCVKTNEDKPILSVIGICARDSSFWQYKVYVAKIRFMCTFARVLLGEASSDTMWLKAIF